MRNKASSRPPSVRKSRNVANRRSPRGSPSRHAPLAGGRPTSDRASASVTGAEGTVSSEVCQSIPPFSRMGGVCPDLLRVSAGVGSVAVMDVIEWMLDSDPALRWQVLDGLTDATEAEVAAERDHVASEGWGAQLLALQSEEGLWDGGVYRPGWAQEDRPFFDAWTATHFVLQQLADLGLDPANPRALEAVSHVRDHVRWDHAGEPYFDGETEP